MAAAHWPAVRTILEACCLANLGALYQLAEGLAVCLACGPRTLADAHALHQTLAQALDLLPQAR